MHIELLIAFFGAILFLVGIVGGGVWTKWVAVQEKLGIGVRLFLVIVGLIMLIWGILSHH